PRAGARIGASRPAPRRRVARLPGLPSLAGAVDATRLPHVAGVDARGRRRPALPPRADRAEQRDPPRAELLEAASGGRVRPRPIASASMPETTLVLGAGPAGLTAAYVLGKAGRKAVVLEAERQVGGLAKTVEIDGFRFDLGGHRFFTKAHEVEALWDEIMGDELLLRPRMSRI